MKSVTVFLMLFSATGFLNSQIVNPGTVLKRNVESRINRKVEKGINDGLDQVENDVKNGKSGDSSSKSTTNTSKTGENAQNPKAKTLVSYSKFDFIPGEKIIAEEKFENTNVGDFPINWNSNSTAEIVNVEDQTGKFLSFSKEGTFLQEDIKSLPENFTYQFNLLCNPEFSFYSSGFNLVFAALKNPSTEFIQWGEFKHGGSAVSLQFHPTDAGMQNGTCGYVIYNSGVETMKNSVKTSQFHSKTSNFVKVSIWRQKNRLRVYLNDEKVIDLPRAFSPGVEYNSLVYWMGGTNQPIDRYLVSDIRFAIGSPDTRSKLITEGKFVTRGILFDSGSDKIKPESYGALKDIALVLKDNPETKVRIVGYTDSDGDANANLKLSERRALAIKEALNSEFGIDKSRMETLGKGETEPVESNLTEAGKANNRRVEFIKI